MTDGMRVVFEDGEPMVSVPAESEKGHKDRLLPIAPEFAEFLLCVPAKERSGYVFSPRAQSDHGQRLTLDRVSRLISAMGKSAGIVVDKRSKKENSLPPKISGGRLAFGGRNESCLRCFRSSCDTKALRRL